MLLRFQGWTDEKQFYSEVFLETIIIISEKNCGKKHSRFCYLLCRPLCHGVAHSSYRKSAVWRQAWKWTFPLCLLNPANYSLFSKPFALAVKMSWSSVNYLEQVQREQTAQTGVKWTGSSGFQWETRSFIYFNSYSLWFTCVNTEVPLHGLLLHLAFTVLLFDNAELQFSCALQCSEQRLTQARVRPEQRDAAARKQLGHWITATPAAAGSTYCSPLPDNTSLRHLSRAPPGKPMATQRTFTPFTAIQATQGEN